MATVRCCSCISNLIRIVLFWGGSIRLPTLAGRQECSSSSLGWLLQGRGSCGRMTSSKGHTADSGGVSYSPSLLHACRNSLRALLCSCMGKGFFFFFGIGGTSVTAAASLCHHCNYLPGKEQVRWRLQREVGALSGSSGDRCMLRGESGIVGRGTYK